MRWRPRALVSPAAMLLSGAVALTAAATALAASGTVTGHGASAHVGGVAFQTATALADGRVFVAGGRNDGGTFLHGELYDWTVGSFSVAGAVDAAARSQHTATLLPGGRVLVAGGRGIDSSVFRSASLYDPTSDSWSSTGSMVTPRFAHTATPLPDGRVLIAGGADRRGGGNEVASAELYDPSTGAFIPTRPSNPAAPTTEMRTPRSLHTATLLAGGTVLIAGGGPDSATGALVERYDPATGVFTAVRSMTAVRWGHTATLLPDGKVLITGGGDFSFLALHSAEVYDPATGVFTRTGSMETARFGHTATLLPNGKVLIAGGQDRVSDTLAFRTAFVELYDPATGTFSPALSLKALRSHHTATLLPSGDVLIHGGQTDLGVEVGYLASAELYRPVPPPRPSPPSFSSFSPGAAGDAAALGWRATDALLPVRFEFCSAVSAQELPGACREVDGPLVDVNWDTFVGDAGVSDETRVFTSGWRFTALRACNVTGCSAFGAGPQAGGLRWPRQQIDFDYFAMAFDVGALRFTIVGVVNVSGPPRTFELTTGPATDPRLQLIRSCRQLPAGGVCVDFLGPGDDHYAIVDLISTRSGTPTTEHRIQVR